MSEKIIVRFSPYAAKMESRDDHAKDQKEFCFYGEHIVCSDGYHTFDELYDHRIELFIALCKKIKEYGAGDYSEKIWRSRLHDNGSSFDGWFIMGITDHKTKKQLTYHLPNIRWNDTEFAETLDRAPEFDGHTPEDVLERLRKL